MGSLWDSSGNGFRCLSWEFAMTLGLAPKQGDLLRSTVGYCEGRVAADSIYGVLHRECFTLFPDEMFADLFTYVGRRSVPPMIVAVVMVLQRIEGCSDREAVDRFAFDARWKYAAGGLDFDYPGFVHTVLVDMRARLASSAGPDRLRKQAGPAYPPAPCARTPGSRNQDRPRRTSTGRRTRTGRRPPDRYSPRSAAAPSPPPRSSAAHCGVPRR